MGLGQPAAVGTSLTRRCAEKGKTQGLAEHRHILDTGQPHSFLGKASQVNDA